MWLRNWDNVQRIKTSYSVEKVSTKEFGDNSKALKNVKGEVVTGSSPANFISLNENSYSTGAYYIPLLVPGSNSSSYLKQPVYNGDFSAVQFFNSIYGPLSIYYGIGVEEVTYDDYNITKNENLIITETFAPIYDIDIGKKEEFCIYRTTVKNTGTENLTVSEVGLFAPYDYSSSSGGTLLVYRDLLPYPQELQPGEIKTLYLELRRKYSQV